MGTKCRRTGPFAEGVFSGRLLNIARIGRGSGAADGEHDLVNVLVNVLVDGHYQHGLASASLALEGHDGRPGCCIVFVPQGVMADDSLVLDYADHLFAIAPNGRRHYTFATREAALSFLRSLYGIDAPQPEPVDAITASPCSVPVPLRPGTSFLPLSPLPPERPTGLLFTATL